MRGGSADFDAIIGGVNAVEMGRRVLFRAPE